MTDTPATSPARAWAESVIIPTYGVGAPDKNPMFLEKRIYQGSSGVVYPHPVIDRVSDDKHDQTYTAVFMENPWLKIMMLPELGGRVQMALDKTNDYHFIYYNRVIKPALVGLAGPWISGGIEFNWPQHHRPSTFEPVDWRIDQNADGSVTVWCSEIERMFRTKGMHAFTLHPDRAVLQIDVQLYNRTSEPQTFLWWANRAVHVNDDYQSIFPPDVHAVMDHGKRDVSTFPIATGTYYKVDYSPGTDISRYKNIPVPTSYMAHHSDFDFVGDYDHGKKAGMMHVANHHLVPGKKQWTWGYAGFGQAWDRQLTDEDGPYIELMCGAFTDNQPDFSWLQPGEEKRFTQFFMPYKHIGGARNASTDAVINLEFVDGSARYGVYVTQPRSVCIILTVEGVELLRRTVALSPATAEVGEMPLPAGTVETSVRLSVVDAVTGRALLAFQPAPPVTDAPPTPATPARTPADIASADELFINGLHLEQYRHATFAPEPYYEEALRRDPLDSRCNNALGLLLLRRGMFARAEPYFRAALKRLTARNPNPYDGEASYNLGLALRFQARYAEAFDAFYKAVWNDAWQSPAYFELARLASRAGRLDEALDLAGRALVKNWHHQKARALKIALLRQLGHADRARAEVALALDCDPMDPAALWESAQMTGGREYSRAIRPSANTHLELALDYLHAGLHADALAVLRAAPGQPASGMDPLLRYATGYALQQSGDDAAALAAWQSAAALPPDYCFPNMLELVPILEAAQRANPADARAPYYLGNFFYAHRRHAEAIALWERAAALDPGFATAWRNLGLAYVNKLGDAPRAHEAYERAFAANPDDARVLFELDQLRARLGVPPAERLAELERHLDLVDRRDDLSIEHITLQNTLGRHDAALARLLGRTFHPWEGGEGKTTAQYVAALLGQARAFITAGDNQAAIACALRAQTLPHNLGEGKLPSARDNDIYYTLGLANAAAGDADAARACFERATTGVGEPTSAVFYNDQPPEMIYYQGLAHARLGNQDAARAIFQKLIDYGRAHMDDRVQMDYFAVSLPTFLVFDEDLDASNRAHCNHMIALGTRGTSETLTGLGAL